MPYKYGLKDVYFIGEKESGKNLRYETYPQSFENIRSKCLQRNTLFEDVEFPVTNESIGVTGAIEEGRVEIEKVVWLRPKEILGKIGEPRFRCHEKIGEGFQTLNRFDVKQGFLGDCWFLASLANATTVPELAEIIFPFDNTFDDDNYCGAFHFRFWNHGFWVDVVIDDRLPCIWNESKQKYNLIFARYSETFLFWAALAEKAYAKLHDSFEHIESGDPMEAMEDFTGGISEAFDLTAQNLPEDLFDILLWSKQRNSIIAAGTGEADDTEDVGLVARHAFSVTGLSQFPLNGKLVRLLRIRNPWGGNIEWNGRWSDRSTDWDSLSDEEKTKFDLKFEHDGEFWMEYSDFLKYFVTLQLCQMSPITLDEDPDSVNWYKIKFQMKRGSFTKQKFDRRSQHLVIVEHFSEEPEQRPEDENVPCFILVALMNNNIHLSSLCEKLGQPVPEYGFYLFRIDNPEKNRGPFTPAYFNNRNCPKIGQLTDNGESKREIVGRFTVPAGTYCIIPYCSDPHFQGDYLLRIISEKKATTSAVLETGLNKATQNKLLELTEIAFEYKNFKVEVHNLIDELREKVKTLENQLARISSPNGADVDSSISSSEKLVPIKVRAAPTTQNGH